MTDSVEHPDTDWADIATHIEMFWGRRDIANDVRARAAGDIDRLRTENAELRTQLLREMDFYNQNQARTEGRRQEHEDRAFAAEAQVATLTAELANEKEIYKRCAIAADAAEATVASQAATIEAAEKLLGEALTIRMCADPWLGWDRRCERFLRRSELPAVAQRRWCVWSAAPCGTPGAFCPVDCAPAGSVQPESTS